MWFKKKKISKSLPFITKQMSQIALNAKCKNIQLLPQWNFVESFRAGLSNLARINMVPQYVSQRQS